MNKGQGMTIEDIEEQAVHSLTTELAEHLAFNSKVWAIAVRALDVLQRHDLRRMPRSRKICLVLLTCLANNLRCVALLSERGYSEQAAIIGASIFEIAHTICFIGADEDRAQSWINHKHPRRSFRPIPELIRATAQQLDAPNPAEAVKVEQRVYAQLCWPKHASRLILGIRPPDEHPTHGKFYLGPETDDFSVRTAWFALQHSGRHGLLAVDMIQNTHATVLGLGDIIMECRSIYDQLVAQSKERWGTEDPFEGQW